tara:strand:- start:352 stop:894 length:543 start_codon:yes stop_codon:yes gene_type:complete
MEFLFTEENIKLFFILFGVGFATIFIMALTNKVVVFQNSGDLTTTLGLMFVPLIGIISLSILRPSEAAQDYNDFTGSGAAIFVSVSSVLAFIYCLVKTFTNSIASNGLGIGIAVAIFKIVSAGLLIIAAIGFINKLTENNRNPGVMAIIIGLTTGIFAWILKVLINGEKVAQQKNLDAAQ